jgi:hypothetical protein
MVSGVPDELHRASPRSERDQWRYQWGHINGVGVISMGSDSIGSEQSYIGTRESHAEEKLSSKYIDTQEVKQ